MAKDSPWDTWCKRDDSVALAAETQSGIVSKQAGGKAKADYESVKGRDGHPVCLCRHFKFLGLLSWEERTRYAYPGSLEFPVEHKTEAEGTEQHEPWQEFVYGHGKGEEVHPWMGWVGYYSVADMMRIFGCWNEWLRRRIHIYQWKEAENLGSKLQVVRHHDAAGLPVGAYQLERS